MKGIIKENLEAGQYAVEIVWDTTRLDAEIEALNRQRIEIVQELLDARIVVIEKEQRVNELADAIDAVIGTMK